MDLRLYRQLEQRNPNFIRLLNRYPSRHYKVYKIPKRTFGFRTIAQPTPNVKQVQKLVISLLSEKVNVHPCATAYVQGKSIKDNASYHVKSEYLLKVDLENFFNSITPKMLFKALKKQSISLTDQDMLVLEQCLFWNMSKKLNGKLVLSVGAPSSPYISNVIMYSFDKRMSKICAKNNINYTRYADDLTFSTNTKGLLFGHLSEIRKLLKKEFGAKLTLNESKTVFSSKAHNRHITGVTITNNNKLSLGRDRKRYISALIHKFKHNQLSEDDIYHLKGLISHALHIESKFVHRMNKKYSKETLNSIRKYPSGA
ncbi:retron St85 family RNA-directed DNA polymerase [Vibrio alginolyticus]|uniref:retron St85 family RNA-directed DNA polymerase n=1 Tax=Vibrio harveyi group TaxID=717610 RepID=UPI00354DAE77